MKLTALQVFRRPTWTLKDMTEKHQPEQAAPGSTPERRTPRPDNALRIKDGKTWANDSALETGQFVRG
jgi:hypothetical protein